MDSSPLPEKLSCSPKSNDYCSHIHIPDVLLYDILSRLPSKSLVRFRCVSKSWYTRITHDLEFHKLHLLNFNAINGPRWVGYQVGESCNYETTSFWLYDESFSSNKIQAYHIPRVETPVDFYFLKIVGSCNGILCFYLPVDECALGISGEDWGLGKFFICLWNPYVRKFKRVDFPWKASIFTHFHDNFMMGFGLSMRNNEYMVVVICKDEIGEDHVYVYFLKTSSWTEIGTKPIAWKRGLNKDYGTYFNGSLHWVRIDIKQRDYTLLCFNLDDLNFCYMSPPPTSQSSPNYDCFKTLVCNYMLSVWETIEVGDNFAVNIWIMKEYGDCSSWTIFQKIHVKEDYWFQYRYFCLFGMDEGGRLLFKTKAEDDSPLRACDPHSGEIQEFQACEAIDIWDMAPYQESLALL